MRSIDPTAVPLTIAKTGFYANTLPASVITAVDGSVASIDVMLRLRQVHHGEGAKPENKHHQP